MSSGAAGGSAGPYAASRRRLSQHQHNRVLARKVLRYDGQTIVTAGRSYELGSYLGGGAAGVVYEAMDLQRGGEPHAHSSGSIGSGRSHAVKILNPLGFRLLPTGALQRCLVAVKGAPLAGGGRGARLEEEHVWWLVHPVSKAVVAAYADPKSGALREVTLPKCIEVWGWDGLGGGADHFHPSPRARQQRRQHWQHQQPQQQAYQGYGNGNVDEEEEEEEEEEDYLAQESKMGGALDAGGFGGEEADRFEKVARMGREVLVNGVPMFVPRVPAKFLNWLRARRRIYKEIESMERLGAHPNVVRLQEVLELLQDSKSTLFLVLELVTGGELFERIPLGCGTTEETARRYFAQLVSGVGYCHARGVCHRDIKPENLLLDEQQELKIADFGLSTAFAIAAGGGGDVMLGGDGSSSNSSAAVRRLRSVVGSPFYCAPEVSQAAAQGYDGRKADAYSCGVILYAMLVGTLPFGRDLSQCPRFQRFRRWLSSSSSSSSSVGDGSSSGGGGSPLVLSAASRGCSTGSVGSCSASGSGSSSPVEAVVQEGEDQPATTTMTTTTSMGGAGAAGTTPWLFPVHVSPGARSLVVQLLHPDPARRLSVEAAACHPWVLLALGGEAAAALSPAGGARISCSSSLVATAAAATGSSPSSSAVAAASVGGGGSARASPIAEGSTHMQAVLQALRSLSEGNAPEEHSQPQPPLPRQPQHQQLQQLPVLFTHGLTVPSPPPPPILEGDEEEGFFSASPGRPA